MRIGCAKFENPIKCYESHIACISIESEKNDLMLKIDLKKQNSATSVVAYNL